MKPGESQYSLASMTFELAAPTAMVMGRPRFDTCELVIDVPIQLGWADAGLTIYYSTSLSASQGPTYRPSWNVYV